MKLHRNTLNDFAIWYHDQGYKLNIVDFYCLPDSCKYGVKVDFFDSVGMVVSVDSVYVGEPQYNLDAGYEFEISVNDDLYGQYKTRTEARTKAIELANEIYNEQKS